MSKGAELVEISRLQVRILQDGIEQTRRERGRTSTETWRRVRQLGVGGFATVHLERCSVPNGHILRVVKQLKKDLGSGKIDYHRELEAAALFSHSKYQDSFVQSFGWYESPEHVFLTMEYLDLGDLSKHIGRRFPEAEARSIVHQILVALEFMHERDFIHRDLKPANILICQRGPAWWIKVADFGISKRALDGDTTLRTRVYTPRYAAPEVSMDGKPYTRAVDIWSLGIITHELLTGKPTPFGSSGIGRYYFHSEDFPSQAVTKSGVAEVATEFVARMLTSIPEKRPLAAECLQHDWMTAADDDVPQDLCSDTDRPPSPTTTEQSLMENFVPWTTIESHSPMTPSEAPPPADTSVSQDSSTEPIPSFPRRMGRVFAENPVDVKDIEIDQPRFAAPVRSPSRNRSHPALTRFPVRPRTTDVHQKEVAASPPRNIVERNSSSRVVQPAGAGREPFVYPGGFLTDHRNDGHQNEILSVAFSSDGTLLASGSIDTLRLWDVATKSPKQMLTGEKRGGCALAFSPDGMRLAASQGSLKNVRFWDLATGEILQTLARPSQTWSLTFSPDGAWLARKSGGVIELCNATTGKPERTLTCRPRCGMAFSPDGTKLASASSIHSTLQLHDVATGAPVPTDPHAETPFKGHESEIRSVAFSPDGAQLASASVDKTVRIWSVATGKLLQTLRGHENRDIFDVAFLRDSVHLVTFPASRKVRLWNTATGAIVQTLDFDHQIFALALSPDGTRLALAVFGKAVYLYCISY